MIKMYEKINLMAVILAAKLKDEEGAGVIELAVIILVLIGLALIFKDKVNEILNNIFDSINNDLPSING